ncbi:MAG: arginine--tRNA ligase [Thaumarchaeota archaeon]|nr:arginine--tRNA ligase [Candidatus Calditenuaceae archaeon]MDW8186550.1 arginine--tRNA ligase [Nitrososphaerota archaeon]
MSIRRAIEEAKEALRRAGVREPKVVPTKSLAFGVVTSTSVLEEARERGLDALAHAEAVSERARGHLGGLLADVRAATPGYVNFFPDWWRFSESVIRGVLEDVRSFLYEGLGEGEVVIEHTSVNPNKALHVGHARNVCIGDTISRLMTKAGRNVRVINYVDDSGAQMAELLLGFAELGFDLNPPMGMRFDEYCGDMVYVEVNRRAKVDPEIEVKRRKVAKELEDRGSEFFRLSRDIALRVLRDQLRTCHRLGARYDMLVRESDVVVSGLWDEAFTRLKVSGAIYLANRGSKAGCWVADLSGHPVLSKEGDEVLVKSDGSTTYVARDIAFALWKLGESRTELRFTLWEVQNGRITYISSEDGIPARLGPPRLVITVVDSRQKRPQEVVRYALSRIGVGADRYVHYSYEPVLLSKRSASMLGAEAEGEAVQMSGREGIYFKVEEVLNELVEVAVRETSARRPEWSKEKVREIAEAIAIGAFRYGVLKVDSDRQIVFDIEESLKLEGDTGPYLQYSAVRAKKILLKAEEIGIEPSPTPSGDLTDAEMRLVREISIVPLTIEDVVRTLRIRSLVTQARTLATVFNEFYESCPVIGGGSNASFRLGLVASYLRVQEELMETLGVPVLDEL